jgi:hypothetical protein
MRLTGYVLRSLRLKSSKVTGESREALPGYSPEDLQQAAENGQLMRILAEHAVKVEEDDMRPIPRRKFSELKGFDRSSFDQEAYDKELESGRPLP